jgi:molecular chaperone Hsp33
MRTDDLIKIFTLENTGFRGRIVRMGGVLDTILAAHAYPEAVSHAAAEAAVLAALLSSMLKYQGVFTLQAQGDGPVAVVVADLTSGGELRACATIREGRAAEIEQAARLPIKDMLGKGYLAFTVDQGPATERYQGIVELKEEGLLDSINNYFRQSEQIMTGVKLAVTHKDGCWRAGGILIQHVPEEGGIAATSVTAHEDSWTRTMMLLETCTDAELSDPGLDADSLLYRLFHEEGVRVFEPLAISKGCRCTPERLTGILASMTNEDRREMVVDGAITMTCQFCSRDFKFDPDNLTAQT